MGLVSELLEQETRANRLAEVDRKTRIDAYHDALFAAARESAEGDVEDPQLAAALRDAVAAAEIPAAQLVADLQTVRRAMVMHAEAARVPELRSAYIAAEEAWRDNDIALANAINEAEHLGRLFMIGIGEGASGVRNNAMAKHQDERRRLDPLRSNALGNLRQAVGTVARLDDLRNACPILQGRDLTRPLKKATAPEPVQQTAGTPLREGGRVRPRRVG